jgi:hypothetical protein
LLARKNGRVLEVQAETRKYYCIDMNENRNNSHLFYAPPIPKLTTTSSAALDMLQCMPADGQSDFSRLFKDYVYV